MTTVSSMVDQMIDFNVSDFFWSNLKSMLKRSFSFKKSSARKFTVPNPLKLNSQDVNRELGEELETVDVKVGKHRVKFDPATGQWQTSSFLLTKTFFDWIKRFLSFLFARKSSNITEWSIQRSDSAYSKRHRIIISWKQYVEIKSGNYVESCSRIDCWSFCQIIIESYKQQQ